MENIDLRSIDPCPFCGERLVTHYDHHGTWIAHKNETGKCIISTYQLFSQDDVDKWNARPKEYELLERIGILMSKVARADKNYQDLLNTIKKDQ